MQDREEPVISKDEKAVLIVALQRSAIQEYAVFGAPSV